MNTNNSDSCLNNCTRAKCGDGYIEVNVEQCDDGNVENVDGCSSRCKKENIVVYIPSCGDGQINTNEECDDGNLEAGDGCD